MKHDIPELIALVDKVLPPYKVTGLHRGGSVSSHLPHNRKVASRGWYRVIDETYWQADAEAHETEEGTLFIKRIGAWSNSGIRGALLSLASQLRRYRDTPHLMHIEAHTIVGDCPSCQADRVTLELPPTFVGDLTA